MFNYKRALSVKSVELPEGERPIQVLGTMEGPTPETVSYRELDRFTLGDKTYLIGATDGYFLKGVWLTLRYAVISVPLGMLGALAVALLLNQNIRGVGFWRTLYYLPAVLPAAAVALLWFWLFAPNSGLVNWFLSPRSECLAVGRPGGFTEATLGLP